MAAVSLDDEKAKNVLRQVEFYFSDSNLPRDNFLKKTVDESEDGLVSLALICSFSRMKKHLGLDATLKPEEVPEESVLAVAEVLRRSAGLRVSEDGKKVGRSTLLGKVEQVVEQLDSRTVAASPLPYDVNLEVVESFFAQHGKVNSVRLPRHVLDKRHFCGTALIEFSEEADATKVLKEMLVYAGAELELKPKKEFDAEREKKRAQTGVIHFNKTNKDGGGYTKGLIIAFKLKSKSAENSEAKHEANKVTESSDDQKTEDAKVPSQAGEEVATDDTAQNRKNGKVMAEPSSGGGETKSSEDGTEKLVTREDLKAVFAKFGTVKYIDFRMGEESGYIRFEDPEAAVKARAMAALSDQDGLRVKTCIATIEALTGEAEKEYWNLIQGNQKSRENKNQKGRGGKPFRGGRKFDGKRGRQNDSAHKQPNKSRKLHDDDE